MNFVALDVETAVGPRWSICQVGLVFVENGKVVDTFVELVQPPDNNYSYWNTKIHGITAEDTKKTPFFPEIWKKIQPMIENKLIVAHNAPFDIDCMQKTLKHYKLDVPDFQSECTYRMSGMNLKDASQKYNIKLDNHHDALADAMACAEIYMKIK